MPIDGASSYADPGHMQPHAVSSYARWAADLRGEGRAVRVAAHVEAGFLVISTWKSGVCVGTVRLVPAEAAELLAGVAQGLAELANGLPSTLAAEPAPSRDTVAIPLPAVDLPG